MHSKHERLELLVLAALLLTGLILVGSGFGPYWDSWLFYNRALPWSIWLSSWWSQAESPSLFHLRTFFPDAHRHPPFMEIGGGIFHAIFKNWLGHLGACRLIVELFTVIWLCASFRYVKARRGYLGAFLVVALFLGSPRFLPHGVRFGIDGLIASLYGLTVLAMTRWHWAPNVGVLMFCLLTASFLTKIQAFYLILLFLFWIVWSTPREKTERRQRWLNRCGNELAAGLALVLIALLAAFLCWPALWLDFPKGIQEFLDFNFKHVQIAVLYFGGLYGQDHPPPWHYPWGFTAIALPLTLFLPVLIRLIRYIARGIKKESVVPAEGGHSGWRGSSHIALTIRDEEVLLWLAAGLPLLISSLPGVPRFDGIRLFLPAFGPWVILAAYEILDWWRWIERGLRRYLSRWLCSLLLVPIIFSMLLPTFKIYPFNLCYYSPLIGGISGARRLGFDLDYLGMSMHLLNPTLNLFAEVGDILLLRGGNSLVYKSGPEGWVPIPPGILVGRFEITPPLLEVPGKVFVILGSRYSDETWQDRKIRTEVPALGQITYEGERLWSLHQLNKQMIATLLKGEHRE